MCRWRGRRTRVCRVLYSVWAPRPCRFDSRPEDAPFAYRHYFLCQAHTITPLDVEDAHIGLCFFFFGHHWNSPSFCFQVNIFFGLCVLVGLGWVFFIVVFGGPCLFYFLFRSSAHHGGDLLSHSIFSLPFFFHIPFSRIRCPCVDLVGMRPSSMARCNESISIGADEAGRGREPGNHLRYPNIDGSFDDSERQKERPGTR
ncbi:hypothetical protein LZ32DRAFT_299677 [Colletotrichum eremochloae]|nr:hypothetical protein LZ32DRAFT_299677 [Colletotrichum eremochloae]